MCIKACQILQHTDHGRIVVPQNIQFQKVCINGVIVKMCRDNIRIVIVCRMLHRSKRIDIFSKGQYDNTAGMLSRGSPDTGASLYNPVNFTIPLMHAPFFIIILHISECRLVRQRTNRPRPERLTRPEDHLRIFMSLTLIFSGKIQVNIRLLISFKSEECLKGNIKSHLIQRRPTVRTLLIRHITTCPA